MSRMQEGAGAVKCDHAHLDKTTTPKANNQEPVARITEPSCHEGRDFFQSRGYFIAWTVPHPTSADERSGSEKNRKPKSSIIVQAGAPDRKGSSHGRSRSTGLKGSCRLPLGRDQEDSLSAQIRTFNEREDLRECLLPGIVGRISRKACEGWRRQATARSARFMSKIKLGPCKDCKYFEESIGEKPRIHSERRSRLGKE